VVGDPQQASAAESTVAIYKEKSVEQRPRREEKVVEYKKREPKPYTGFMVGNKVKKPVTPLALTANASVVSMADAKPPKPVDMDRIASLSKPA